MFDEGALHEAVELLGQLLADRGHAFHVVAIGGGGLLLIGLIERSTKDLDLVGLRDGDTIHPVGGDLPRALADAANDVARVLDLGDGWINSGPESLLRFGLPQGFIERVDVRVYGGLTISLASRFDQIHFKLYAAADDKPDGKHHVDLKRLEPTHEELRLAARWARTHDDSEGFALMLTGVLRSFGLEERT